LRLEISALGLNGVKRVEDAQVEGDEILKKTGGKSFKVPLKQGFKDRTLGERGSL
jgi:hypothetical protein